MIVSHAGSLETLLGTVAVAVIFAVRKFLLMDVSRLEVSSDIPAGTLRLDATYDSAGPELAVWTDSWAEGNQEWVHVSWQAADDLALLFSCKDQLLSDLRDRRVTSYVPAELREMVVTVNPADADRIALL